MLIIGRNSFSKNVQYFLKYYFRYGIDVVGIASDGDPRLLSAMKTRTSNSISESSCPLSRPICIQDTIHILTKLRNRLLNSSIVLKIGNRDASNVHVKYLVDNISKGEHELTNSDIYPEDRQNYGSVEKLLNPKVSVALENHVPNSEGTVMYIDLCKRIGSSFMQEELSPIERVYNMWYCVYFIRCWRKHIRSKANPYTLLQNFISPNAYMCVEINAHGLVELIFKLRSSQKDHLFLPTLFSSQPCESIFRLLRSMSTANYTKISFCLQELLLMVSRVDMMNTIAYDAYEKCTGIEFPRIYSKLKKVYDPIVLPNEESVLQAMKRAQNDAIKKAAEFNIILKLKDIEKCEIELTERNLRAKDRDPKANDESDHVDDGTGEVDEDIEEVPFSRQNEENNQVETPSISTD